MQLSDFAVVVAIFGFVWVTLTEGATTPADNYAQEKETNYWRDIGHAELQTILNTRQGGVAKNVILFLGDGMGVSTVTAGRIWTGQQQGLWGEEFKLSWDKFPFTGLSKTYNTNTQTTDSAASGTAFLCGVKTNQGLLGLNAHATRSECSTAAGHEVESILAWALASGKSTGLVSTARITHATPGAAYAKTPERDWESDRDVPDTEKDCKDVAYQLVMENPNIQVLMGGGRGNFLPEGTADPDPDPEYEIDEHSRTDNLNLVDEWIQEKQSRGVSHSYVYDKTGFDNVDPETTDYILGLFNQEHMQYEAERNKTKEPSIKEMTEKAIQILSRNSNGFFLLVEGGRIDHANHQNWAHKTFAEVDAMQQAVQAAKDFTSDQETLIVVTADHSHVLAIAGYASRGTPILELSRDSDGVLNVDKASDGLPYTTLIYGNGPGYVETNGPRENLTTVDTTTIDFRMPAAVPMDSETHAGEDVAIYATGPQSFLYAGVHEQSYIPMAMAYAACIGPYADGNLPCARDAGEPRYQESPDSGEFEPDSALKTSASFLQVISLAILTLLPIICY